MLVDACKYGECVKSIACDVDLATGAVENQALPGS